MKAYYLITAWQGVNPRMDFANMSELQEVLEDLKLDFTEVMEDTRSVFHVYDDGTDGLFQVMCRICLSFDLQGFEHYDETPVRVTVTDKGIETTSIGE
jgi:hypothetical protein